MFLAFQVKIYIYIYLFIYFLYIYIYIYIYILYIYIYPDLWLSLHHSLPGLPQLRGSHRVLPSPPKPGHFNDTGKLRVCELEHGPFIYSWNSYFKVVICHILPSGNLS